MNLVLSKLAEIKLKIDISDIHTIFFLLYNIQINLYSCVFRVWLYHHVEIILYLVVSVGMSTSSMLKR